MAPRELRIRPASRDDFDEFVRLFLELETGDQAPSKEAWCAEQMLRCHMAEVDGNTVGYVSTQALPGGLYINQLAVAPTQRRKGYARRILSDVAQSARARGIATWRLNVKPENVAAVALYTALGMQQQYASCSLGIRWRDALACSATGCAVRGPDATEDAALEARFACVPGQLAGRRAQGFRLLVAERDGVAMGVAAFKPDFPGAFPFKVSRPEVSIDLLQAMHQVRAPEHDWVGTVLEDAPDTEAFLLANGAWERLRFVHMSGEVPAAGSFPG